MKTPAVSGACCGSRAAPASDDRPPLPDHIRTEAELLRVVEIGRGDSAFTATFLELLDERHAIYRGVSTAAVTRMRGALLLGLGHRALPTTALPFVLEELESAHDAWLTAIAAHVLRKYPEPSASFAEPLRSAVLNIQHRDGIVQPDARRRRHLGRREDNGDERSDADDRLVGPRRDGLCAEPRGSPRAESGADHIDHGCQGD